MTRDAIRAVCALFAAVILAGVAAAQPILVAPPPRPFDADRVLGPGRVFSAKGWVDLFVAATKAWNLPADDDRLWQPPLDLAWVLVKKADFRWSLAVRPGRSFPRTMAEFRDRLKPRFIRADQSYEQEKVLPTDVPSQVYPGGIMAPGVSSPWALGHNIVVSRGDVRTGGPLGDSIVFADGDVRVGTFLAATVLVCDGNVTVEDRVFGSLVIARGSIRVNGQSISDSTLVAGGTVRTGYRVIPPDQGIVITEKEKIPFRFVTFFELAAVGVEAEAVAGDVWVSAVTDGKPFAKAGARAGDTVIGVNGRRPDSVESLRRLLRDALAVGDATVTVTRAGKVETLRVTLTDP
jgi:hypothetical protein